MKKIQAMAFACALMLGASAFGQDGAPADAIPGGFDEAAIESLFGAYDPEAGKARDTARVLPPFDGNYRIFAARPVYASYDAEENTRWVAAMAELHVRCRVASLPRVYMFTPEEIGEALPGAGDYGKMLSRHAIVGAAKKLGATHIIFQEYQPQSNGKEARYAAELYRIRENAAVVRAFGTVEYSKFERGLDVFCKKIADAMDPGAAKAAAFKASVIGSDRKFIEALGNILAGDGEFTRERAAAAYSAADSAVKKNQGLVGARYAAALLAGRAENYAQAIEHISAVIGKSGDYPALQLRLAGYLRRAGRYHEAAQATEAAMNAPALRIPATMENAVIRLAQGDTAAARAMYDYILQSGEVSDKTTFFKAALLAARAGDAQACEDYAGRAAENGLAFGESELYELGTAYDRLKGHEETAVKYYKMSLGPTQSGEKVWLAIADAYKRAGKREAEADVYTGLFKTNMDAYSEKLKLAGGIYDSLKITEKAEEAYTLFLTRGFFDLGVSIALARILSVKQECQKLQDILVQHMDLPEITQPFRVCVQREADTAYYAVNGKKKLSTAALTSRISGGALAALGITAGILFNERVKAEAQKYGNFGTPVYPKDSDAENYGKVQEMRKYIDSNILYRNIMYITAGAGLGMFTASFFF